MKESAMDRIADTAGGKMAAAIKASGAGAGSDAGTGAAPSTGSEFTGNNLGGDAGGWINQTGGFSELSEADPAQATESHAEWQAKNEGNTFGVEDYVLYMQERASLVDKPQRRFNHEQEPDCLRQALSNCPVMLYSPPLLEGCKIMLSGAFAPRPH